MIATVSEKKLRSSKYRVLGLAGQGQFGQVYCAIHRKTGRLMALKDINRDRLPTHRFLRELRFLLSLNHPNIANCHALEQSATGRQLVLDYCEGGTLRDLMEQELPLTLAEILTLMAEVLTALEHAQEKGIVHCDIKPENILLTITPKGWQAKVSDFGIARLSEELKGDRTGATGSPAYMAPERFYFQSSIASDLYAVGVVLYELLVGDRPFSGNYNQLMVAHLNYTVTIPETLPEGVRSLLLRSLEKLAARRFVSARAMREAVLTVQQALTATELQDRFPKPYTPITPAAYRGQAKYNLPWAVKDLAVATVDENTLLLAATAQGIWGWNLVEDNTAKTELNASPIRWVVDGGVQQVRPSVQGAIARDHNQVYALRFNTLSGEAWASAIGEFPHPIQLCPGGHRWFLAQALAASDTTEGTALWFLDTASRLPPSPHAMPIPTTRPLLQALLLDSRHILGVESWEQQSRLHVLSRWGQAIGTLSLQAPIARIFPTSRPFQFLAQTAPLHPDLLIIRLKPYRVTRCRLDMTVDWAGELVIGYCLVSRSGQMQFVNFQGQIIGRVTDLPEASAIAFQPPYHIWLATSAPEHTLHCIDIRDLALDVVF